MAITVNAFDEEIAILARQLRIGSGIVEAYKQEEFLDPQQFTLALLRNLIRRRNEERAIRNQQAAGFENIKTLDGYDFEHILLPNGFDIEGLCALDFIRNKQNLIMIGSSGTGKTHLATALGVEACRQGFKPFYRRTVKFIHELTQSYERGTLDRFHKRLEQVDLIILDEWGYLPIHRDGMRLLFEVIADAYEKKSVIVTTNLPINEWNKSFGDDRLIHALTDRLYHHGIVVKHEGSSYRLQHSIMYKAKAMEMT